MLPEVGGISRAIRRAVVLLPLPDSPTTATTSPLLTVNETSSRACTFRGWKKEPTGKCFVRLDTSRSGAVASVPGRSHVNVDACMTISIAHSYRVRSCRGDACIALPPDGCFRDRTRVEGNRAMHASPLRWVAPHAAWSAEQMAGHPVTWRNLFQRRYDLAVHRLHLGAPGMEPAAARRTGHVRRAARNASQSALLAGQSRE